PISQWTSPQNDRPDAHRMERRDHNEEDRRNREDVPHTASHTRTPMLRCGNQIPCELGRISILDAGFRERADEGWISQLRIKFHDHVSHPIVVLVALYPGEQAVYRRKRTPVLGRERGVVGHANNPDHLPVAHRNSRPLAHDVRALAAAYHEVVRVCLERPSCPTSLRPTDGENLAIG